MIIIGNYRRGASATDARYYVIGNFVPYDIITLCEDATGAQMKVQADACAHQRAKSRRATLCLLS